jgi:long-chain acyl-CoA synthetase
MTKRTYAAHEADVPSGTLARLFLDAVERFGDQPAFRFFPGPGPATEDVSYREALTRARAAARGLAALGIEPGDRVALLSENRPEWALADYACLLSGIVDVPVYSTLIAEQVAYVLADSGARLVFASTREEVAKALEAARLAERDLRIVAFDAPAAGAEGVISWDELLARGRASDATEAPEDFARRARAIAPDDLATILYTSGTTGDPKGVMLTHDNLHSNVWASSHVLPIGPDDVTVSFLPLSHVFQRMVDYLLLWKGCTIAYAHHIRTVADDLKIVRPTVVVSVPRLYEKIYARVMDERGIRARIVAWATRVGARWAEARLAGREPTAAVRLQYALADRVVFRKIRDGVGGRLRFFVSGGAPLSPEIALFLYSAGLVILEGYGLTETSPVTNVNPPDALRIGTVGPPVPGTEVRIAEDGEIQVRGPQVMKGYYQRPEDTAEVIDEEGWFSTGDVGEITDEGYLRITDRKKDIIVTAGGKNIAPQPIENRLKSNPYVEQVVMVGDRRRFAALLVVPDFGALEGWARERGLSVDGRDALVRDPAVQELMETEVMEHLGPLSGFERPKKLALLTREFTIADGTLTPTQKVKRRVVQERFQHLIDRFYARENEGRTVLVAEEEEEER